jgi:hypothetical protein
MAMTYPFHDARADPGDEALDGLGPGRRDDEGGARLDGGQQGVALFEAALYGSKRLLQRGQEPLQLASLVGERATVSLPGAPCASLLS